MDAEHLRDINMPFKPEVIPLDCLPLVLEHLPSRRDLAHCALVDRAFHNAAIPILYRTLDAQIRVVVSLRCTTG